MTKFERFIYQNLHSLRRLTQWLALGFVFLVPLLNRWGVNDIIGTFYSIRVGNLDIVDPALVLQTVLLTKELYFPLLLAGFIPLVITLFFGKVFCSWICPFNLLAEFADKIRQKVRPNAVRLPHRNPKGHHYWLVYGSILTFVAVFGVPLISLISMPGLITGQVADFLYVGTIGFELLAVPLILIIEIFFAPRFWCKYACPVGATLALLRAKNTLRIKFDAHKCTYAHTRRLPCQEACPLHLNPMKFKDLYPYCFNCGECVDACRVEGQALNFTLQPVEKIAAVHIAENHVS